MDSVASFPDRKTIEAEASAWIVQLDGGEPSQEDLAALREWMGRSSAHRQAIEKLSDLWDDLNVFRELAVPRPDRSRASHSGIFRRFFNHLAGPVPAAIAACLLLIAAIVVTSHVRNIDPPATRDVEATSTAAATQAVSHATLVGEQRAIELADGSRIMLNTDTAIEIDFGVARRDIRLLRGEALFEVAKDADRPFRVFAGSGLVRAVGTAFTIYLKDPDNVSVTVTEGEVELASVSSAGVAQKIANPMGAPTVPLAKIKAGQIATFGIDIESIQTLKDTELSRQLAWRDGMLHFDGQPLAEAVQEINRYTTQDIVILDPALRELRIGGYFKVGETEAMFDALESSFGIRVDRINEDLVQLRARH